MTRKFKMENLECANCAAKMERTIGKIDGVQRVNISFMMQTMTIEADESDFARIMELAKKQCRKIEPDCKIVL